MYKQCFLFLGLVLVLATSSYAQFSAGVIGGVGYLSQRQESSLPGYTLLNSDAVRPVVMAGFYGQFATKGKRGIVAGFQLQL